MDTSLSLMLYLYVYWAYWTITAKLDEIRGELRDLRTTQLLTCSYRDNETDNDTTSSDILRELRVISDNIAYNSHTSADPFFTGR
jgi:hypothetical protein